MSQCIGENGKIVEVTSSELAVAITQEISCGDCPIHDTCHTARKILRIPRVSGFSVGDAVQVRIERAKILGISALIYGVPLAALLIGILLPYLLIADTLSEDARIAAATGAGIMLFTVSSFVISRVGAKISSRLQYRIVAIR